MKGGLTSSSGSLSTAAKQDKPQRKRSRRTAQNPEFKREFAATNGNLKSYGECQTLYGDFRPALDIVYAEVMKNVNNQEEMGTSTNAAVKLCTGTCYRARIGSSWACL
ncbi:hypothetical protein V1527DRAFT_454972 [Lipomyces starkeyi]